ncbi:hypothetical protein BX600DRAFT_517833 [Xylariales sp. PMI_506]|nr:hypothetical protein BX600DRAFT_517833 [Xylariales sp. PMI_506]
MADPVLAELAGAFADLNDPTPTANHKVTVLAVAITLMLLSWACGLFRLYTRFFIAHSVSWDDYTLMALLITSLAGTISICLLPNYGLGQHFIYLSLDEMSTFLKLFYIANAAYNMSTTLIKISLLLQYLRLYEERAIRVICYVLLVIISLWGLVYTVFAWVPCVPVYQFFDLALSASEKHCYGYGSNEQGEFARTFISQAASNMTFDILVLSLPMYLFLKKKNASTSTKMAMGGLVTGGCLVVFVSIWRLQSLIANQAGTYPAFDPTWYTPIMVILSAAEVDLASVCASVPVFWPVLTDSLGEIFVTKEVQIIYEDQADTFELHRSRSTATSVQDLATDRRSLDHTTIGRYAHSESKASHPNLKTFSMNQSFHGDERKGKLQQRTQEVSEISSKKQWWTRRG